MNAIDYYLYLTLWNESFCQIDDDKESQMNEWMDQWVSECETHHRFLDF